MNKDSPVMSRPPAAISSITITTKRNNSNRLEQRKEKVRENVHTHIRTHTHTHIKLNTKIK